MADHGDPRRGLTLYTRAEEYRPGTGRDPEYQERTIAAGVPKEWFEYPGACSSVLFMDAEGATDGRILLGAVRYGANYKLPRHAHNNGDCLYYVTEGEIRLGNRVLGVGDGFFVPDGAPYAYECGPDGAEVLEFRVLRPVPEGTPGTVWTETPAGWERIIEIAKENHDAWTAAGFGA